MMAPVRAVVCDGDGVLGNPKLLRNPQLDRAEFLRASRFDEKCIHPATTPTSGA